jgi:hypothetical protein
MVMDLIDALKNGDLAGARAAIKANPASAKDPRAIGPASGHAFLTGLILLKKHGADVNALWRGYRPLHNLMQSHAHEETKPTSDRLECINWLLANGADPELPAAWPPARAIVVAAFMGEPEFVKRVAKHSNIDGFAAAALGDLKKFEKAFARQVAKSPSLVHDRDIGGLTAQQCAAGSKMPRRETFATARILLDAGADPRVKTKSWSEDVDAAYFAVGSNQPDVFDLLIDRGADVNDALWSAAWAGKFEMAGARSIAPRFLTARK